MKKVKRTNRTSTPKLSVPDRHRKAIALRTLEMSDEGARIMGGMTKDEASEFLQSLKNRGHR